jgi:two-component system, NarL family, sensor histidine kinase DevS
MRLMRTPLALELAEARLERERTAIIDEQDRIAADLHHNLVQRLFGAGLTLQGVVARIDDDIARRRVSEVVHELDAAIAHIRTTVFAARTGP